MAVRELVENSFPHDEPLLIRRNGRIGVVPIGELVEEGLSNTSCIEIEERYYAPIPEGIEVLTLDDDLRLAFKKVTAVFKHRSPSKLWRLTLQSGRTVTTTSAHNLFLMGDDLAVTTKETRALSLGERVIVPTSSGLSGGMTEVDIFAELLRLDVSETAKIVVHGLAGSYPLRSSAAQLLLATTTGETVSFRELQEGARKLGLQKTENLVHTLVRNGSLDNVKKGLYRVKTQTPKRGHYTIPKDWVRCDSVPLNHLRENPPPLFGELEPRLSVKQGKGSFPGKLLLSREFMRILGYYTSEGSISGSKLTFSFGSHEMDTHVKDLTHCLREVFNVEPTITLEHRSAVNVVLNDASLVFLFEKILRVGRRSEEKRVPWVVFNAPRERVEDYLVSYIRGDGHVQVAKRNRKITLATSSCKLFTDFKFLLTLLGRHYSCALGHSQRRVVNGRTTTYRASYYIYLRQGIAPQACSLPMAQFRADLARKTGSTNLYNKNVQKDWLKRNFAEEALPDAVRRVVYSDAGALPIKSIDTVDASSEWVYDISVEGVERFIGGHAVALLHNSLDAAELQGTLPDVFVRIVGDGHGDSAEPISYGLTVSDNGPGVDSHHVPRAFGKVFYGSKYVLRQSRGMFGMGGTMAVLYGQITTNKPVRIATSTDGKTRHIFEMLIDISENKPIILKKETEDAGGKTGTRVDVRLEGDFVRAAQKIGDYFKQTALVASYANLTLVDPEGRLTTYERATEAMPVAPKETLPHPHGIDVEAFKRLIKVTEEKTMISFMTTHFHRVGDRTASKFLAFAGIDPKAKPEKLNNEQVVKIVEALQRFPEFLPPDASCLSPVGEQILQTGITKELQPEFSTFVLRPPSSYSGFPFMIEVGLAYGGKILEPGLKLIRYANRIPLLYDESSDVSFKVLNEEIDWRRYHVPDDAPLTIITHICSTKVPYKTVGKEYIADRPEIERELRNAMREALRRLSLFLSKKGSMEAVQRKINIYGKYLPLIAKFSTEMAGKKRLPDYKKLLGEEMLAEAVTTDSGEDGEAGEETKIEQAKIEDYN